jgi:hypothetical protein
MGREAEEEVVGGETGDDGSKGYRVGPESACRLLHLGVKRTSTPAFSLSLRNCDGGWINSCINYLVIFKTHSELGTD